MDCQHQGQMKKRSSIFSSLSVNVDFGLRPGWDRPLDVTGGAIVRRGMFHAGPIPQLLAFGRGPSDWPG